MHYNSSNLPLAKQMRSNMTNEENKLWYHLRAKRLYGYKFKRQALIGQYIVDFICPEKNLIIELDGGQHNEIDNIKYDIKRTQYLNSQGYKVIRFWNNEIRDNFDGVMEAIVRELTS